MSIKPTGPGGGLPPLGGADGVVSRAPVRKSEFSQPAPAATAEPLASVAAQFRKSDLQDPAKVEQMLSQCAGTLLDGALGRSNSQLPQNDNQYLADWLRNDPSIRTKLLNYLEQVLT